MNKSTLTGSGVLLVVMVIAIGAVITLCDNNSNENEDTTQIADAQPDRQPDEVPDEQPRSEPISVPTEATVEDPGIHEPEVKTTTFTDPSLPGFSMEYPDSWSMEIKAFDDPEDSKSDLHRPHCDRMCMGIVLTKEAVRLEIIFGMIMDDRGATCSNTQPYKKLDSKWYRIQSDGEYIYTTNIVENKLIDQEDSWNGAMVDGVAIEPEVGTTYAFCDYLTGMFLLERPPGGWSEYIILMVKPQVTSDISEDLLAEIDQMMMSIQGLDDTLAWIGK